MLVNALGPKGGIARCSFANAVISKPVTGRVASCRLPSPLNLRDISLANAGQFSAEDRFANWHGLGGPAATCKSSSQCATMPVTVTETIRWQKWPASPAWTVAASRITTRLRVLKRRMAREQRSADNCFKDYDPFEGIETAVQAHVGVGGRVASRITTRLRVLKPACPRSGGDRRCASGITTRLRVLKPGGVAAPPRARCCFRDYDPFEGIETSGRRIAGSRPPRLQGLRPV